MRRQCHYMTPAHVLLVYLIPLSVSQHDWNNREQTQKTDQKRDYNEISVFISRRRIQADPFGSTHGQPSQTALRMRYNQLSLPLHSEKASKHHSPESRYWLRSAQGCFFSSSPFRCSTEFHNMHWVVSVAIVANCDQSSEGTCSLLRHRHKQLYVSSIDNVNME